MKVISIILILPMLLIALCAIYNQIALKTEADKIVPNGQMIDLGDYSVHVYSEVENDNAPTLVFLSGSATVSPTYFNMVNQMTTWGALSVKLGLLRIPGIYPLNQTPLSKEEAIQQKLLMYRNAVNLDYIAEGRKVYENAQVVKAGKNISCPIIMFSSNGIEIGDFWINFQEKYAKENNIKIIFFDCGHYLHYYKSPEMAYEIKAFLEEIK